MRFVGVFNRDGGTFRTMDMDQFSADATRILGEHGHSHRDRARRGQAADRCPQGGRRAQGFDVLLAGGGDGTISAAAEAAFRSGMPLAVLPAGTMNLFARSLHLPLTCRGARRDRDWRDRGTSTSRPPTASPSSTSTRWASTRGWCDPRGDDLQAAAGKDGGERAGRAARDPPATAVPGRDPQQRGLESRQCSAIIVSNNPFGEGHIPHADELDSGVLGRLHCGADAAAELARLSVDVMLGSWKASPLVAEQEVSEVSLTSRARSRRRWPRSMASSFRSRTGSISRSIPGRSKSWLRRQR